jgi:tetratricopeptide (TPR) repeat protein
VLEALGRRDDALEVLRYASIHAPADADIALDKAKLESVAERLDEARGTLEDCLDAGISGDDRIEVLGRLAALHQSAGGDRQRALAALEEAFVVSEQTAEWGTRLGNAHAQFGDPARAAEVLEQVLVVPAAADDVRHWLTLARLYHRRLERADEAERKLWTLFETFPDQRPVLAALEEFYRAGGNGRVFAEKLAETLQSGRLRIVDSVLGELWSYLGELNMSVLERFGEAEQAFARARALLGADASTVLREAQAVARQKGRGRDAVRLVVDSLVLAPAEVGFWEEASAELEARAVEVGDAARVRVARQMRALFGARLEIEDEQVRRDPTRELGSATAWSLLGVDWIEHELREAMRGTAPLADRVIGRDIPGRREIRTRRYRREDFSAFDAYLAGASHWLGVDIPRVAVSDDVTGATVLDGGLFAVHPSSIAEDEPIRSRFWAGWIAGVAFTQIGAWVGASDDDVRDMLSAVAARGLGLDGYDASRFGDEIGGLLHMAARRTAAAALRDRMRVLDLDLEGSADAAARFGDRCGLVLCGDLRVAVEEIAAAVGRPGSLRDAHAQEFIVEHPRTLDVLRFAARDEYFQARYESGLGQRPRLFE